MINGAERQVAPKTSGIRRDHVARYEWASQQLQPTGARLVVDFASGVGYGTQILADHGFRAIGFDRSREALHYARKHYGDGPEYLFADGVCPLSRFDAAVCFETIEHLLDPHALLVSLRGGSRLLASVPNEDVIPWTPDFTFHYRHYNRDTFEGMLNQAGWAVREWWGQTDRESEVEKNVKGRTLIAVAERA